MDARAARLRAEPLPPPFERLKPLHAPKVPPGPGDWLAVHPEEGQSLLDWRRTSREHAGGPRQALYLQPVGTLSPAQLEVVRLTADYMERFFGLPVRQLQPLPASVIPPLARRHHPTMGQPQVLAPYVLRLLEEKRPADAVALLALTAEDLYPEPSWNFVFGLASPRERVGVWSLYRKGDPSASPRAFASCLRGTLATAVHETAHMLGLQHCIAYECVMNGSNHAHEADARPLEPCPVCLAKLCEATGCEPAGRFERLAGFWQQHPPPDATLGAYLAEARRRLGASG